MRLTHSVTSRSNDPGEANVGLRARRASCFAGALLVAVDMAWMVVVCHFFEPPLLASIFFSWGVTARWRRRRRRDNG